MSYEFYKVVHVVSVLVLFASLGILTVVAPREDDAFRRLAKIAHGAALAVIFVAGFGLMARLGMFGEIAPWAWAKIVLWLGLALIVIPMRRAPQWSVRLWVSALVLGGLAASLAIVKPF